MESSKRLSPSSTELIDWLAAENLLDLEWDFPEDGDLVAAGMDSTVVAQMVIAVEEEWGVVLTKADLTPQNLATPLSLAKLISNLRAKK
jgi:acyl carrier protein